MKLNEQITIEREDNGDYLISWTESFSRAPVEIHALESPTGTPSGEPVYRGDERTVRVESLREPRRHYFHLVPEGGTGVTMGERALALRGGTNFRDFGGYLTDDGRQVLWGKLYRSGRLAIRDPAHQQYVANLGIRKNCDFRHGEDFRRDANSLPEDTESLNLAVDAGSFGTFFQNLRRDQLHEAFMVEVMRDVNRQLVRDYRDQYRRMFAALMALEEGAFLVNCTAGKDRTGFGVALILSALGVPRESVLYDYTLSARYFRPDPASADLAGKYSPEALKIMTSDAVKPIAEARREYLEAAFHAIEELCGSMEDFLEDAYGVGPEEQAMLRERFTTEGPA